MSDPPISSRLFTGADDVAKDASSPLAGPGLSQRKGKNMKKLSLSTLAAQKLAPTIHTSSSMPSTPHSAYTLGRSPPKLPSLNMSMLSISRRPSLPAFDCTDDQGPDSTFSVVKDLQSENAIEADRENDELNVYSSGPVCILSPNLWLYSQPSALEARQFDVVINVAKEIPNPLIPERPHRASAMTPIHESEDFLVERDHERSRKSSSSSCTTTDEDHSSFSSGSDVSDTQIKSDRFGETEYVHMPWQHNQAVTGDLPALTNFIDRRVNLDNKRVLVHCQQGVSRSASLVIAYVMKAKVMDINTAYSYVKDKSHGIGPNMSLIYQLCEWGKLLKSNHPPVHRRSYDANGMKSMPIRDACNSGNAATSIIERVVPERAKSEGQATLPTLKSLQSIDRGTEISKSAGQPEPVGQVRKQPLRPEMQNFHSKQTTGLDKGQGVSGSTASFRGPFS